MNPGYWPILVLANSFSTKLPAGSVNLVSLLTSVPAGSHCSRWLLLLQATGTSQHQLAPMTLDSSCSPQLPVSACESELPAGPSTRLTTVALVLDSPHLQAGPCGPKLQTSSYGPRLLAHPSTKPAPMDVGSQRILVPYQPPKPQIIG